jgi:hypothetical protein
MAKHLRAITMNRMVDIPPTHCPSLDPHRHLRRNTAKG